MKRFTRLSITTSLMFLSALSAEETPFEFTELEAPLLSLEEPLAEESPLFEQEIALIEQPFIENHLVAEISPEEEPQTGTTFSPLLQSTLQSGVKEVAKTTFNINFQQVFEGAPVIYSILFLMSMATVFLWFYSLLKLKDAGKPSDSLFKQLKEKLENGQYEEALSFCQGQSNFLSKMVAAGISTRNHGLAMMLESMQTEGKRITTTFWQRLAFLNDIALIAPMLGLLGTVLGMFYAFYDLNRSMESFSILFDGLGISVGTTVAGLIVAILALMLHSIAKYRLVRVLVRVENEAQSLTPFIHTQ